MSFNSVPALLSWAFETVAGYTGASSSLGKSGGGGGCGSLSPLEQRAAATQVVAYVSTLPVAEKLILLGLYGGAKSLDTIAIGLCSKVPGTYGLASAQCAVLRWLPGGDAITKKLLAERMGKSVRTADSYFNCVAQVLDGLRMQGCRRIERRYVDLLVPKPLPRRTFVTVDTERCALAI